MCLQLLRLLQHCWNCCFWLIEMCGLYFFALGPRPGFAFPTPASIWWRNRQASIPAPYHWSLIIEIVNTPNIYQKVYKIYPNKYKTYTQKYINHSKHIPRKYQTYTKICPNISNICRCRCTQDWAQNVRSNLLPGWTRLYKQNHRG